ncbi:alpha-N-arabinofuranosidase [Capsulimonas corticalis]|uniref:non-reducing end alpha-L-arabinofuranosidase n=1 Tax=Capsulimonas corticalis TaxID=2219043 RepID=A0A402D1R9_9BACT|nr:alpha-L-arabinofuranosidase C-terminal domain-containing protein [Capsulimonas corticalis]BDI28678.1 alpha-N-arabinofuranosidase [Capsulimonas corticalis]
MRHHCWKFGALAAITTAVLAAPAGAASGRLTVKADQPGARISPMLYGLMTEEINHSYDGGLYGELIQNRVFKDDAANPVHWSVDLNGGAAGSIALDANQPIPDTALTTCLRLDVSTAGTGRGVGAANDGYWGIPVKPSTSYRASFYAKADDNFKGPLTLTIESTDGTRVAAQAAAPAPGATWKKYTVTLKTDAAVTEGSQYRFIVSAKGTGAVWLNQISLFPPTFNNRPNGNRIDLMDLQAGMSPTFLRLPGGNYLEGGSIDERFDWKKTLGPIEQRPGHQGPWSYRSTDGLGLLEFLEWCEDLKIEPLLAVYAGYSLDGQHIEPGPALAPFVQDALDEIEYLTGDKNTTWGARRIADGHPKPFPLHYVEIGNEDEFDKSASYDGRYAQFQDAIKAKYPKLQLIATSTVTQRKPDLIDDHFYRTAAEMERDSGHYDNYDRSGPKIFVGEWASQDVSTPWVDADKKGPTPSLSAALGDAAWMIGMERNSDIVLMSCYAPMFVNVNKGARQWAVNLIGYDANASFGSPSYYAQAMFGANKGDVVLPAAVTLADAPVQPAPKGKVGVGTWATQAEFKDIQVTQGAASILPAGDVHWALGPGEWKQDGGVLQQSSNANGTDALLGDAAWTDYTYHVKARKIGGKEGFLIKFHAQDSDNYVQWNIGGWSNTRSTLQRASDGAVEEFGGSKPLTVETGRWYDIRIEVQGMKIRCYLDDQLITEATDTPSVVSPLYTTASRDLKSGDVILKVVNTAADAQTLDVDIQGVKNVAKDAQEHVLTGRLRDINTIDAPKNAAVTDSTLHGAGPTFTHEFPAYSVTVLRLKTKK